MELACVECALLFQQMEVRDRWEGEEQREVMAEMEAGMRRRCRTMLPRRTPSSSRPPTRRSSYTSATRGLDAGRGLAHEKDGGARRRRMGGSVGRNGPPLARTKVQKGKGSTKTSRGVHMKPARAGG